MNVRPAVFDRSNRELRTLRFYFEDHEDDVDEIVWFAGIDIGTEIEEGDQLAEIHYGMAPKEILVAPPWCRGTIQRLRNPVPVNRLRSVGEHLLSLTR